MSTPDERFEVPPAYAEVYERAYRRAYEEGQSQLSQSLTEASTRRTTASRRRIAVPEQRRSQLAAPQRGQRPGEHSAWWPLVTQGGLSRYPVALLITLTALLVLAAFILGWVTAAALG